METLREKVGYCIGQQIGTDLQRQGIDLSPETLAQSIKDVFAGNPPKLDEAQQEQVMRELQVALQAKAEAEGASAGIAARAEGEAFLQAKEAEDGVNKTDSGLLYQELVAGDGPSPKPTDTVECHYRGTFIDGNEFDSSYSRGETASFAVNGVIPGWQEALPMMSVGSKWQLYVPADLAYGNRGAGGVIPPGSTLLFEIELIAIAA